MSPLFPKITHKPRGGRLRATRLKVIRLSVQFLALLIAVACAGAAAQAATPVIELLATFDYPGAGNSTYPTAINDAGDVAGYYFGVDLVTRSFVRLHDGSFSPPIVEPNDTDHFTEVAGGNNLHTLCGVYAGVGGATYHGFFVSATGFTEFDAPGATSTFVDGINDAGDFCGSVDFATAFISVGGNLTFFSIPGVTTDNAAQGINNLGQCVGNYTDAAHPASAHGFFRDADGTLTYPIDAPGSFLTVLFDINDQGRMVGRYYDHAQVAHALLVLSPSPTKFVSYDYPGSTFTSFNGINRHGLICGRYLDSSGIYHGIIARVHGKLVGG